MPCPSSTCDTDHAPPEPGDDGRWQCPTTLTWFYNCARCGRGGTFGGTNGVPGWFRAVSAPYGRGSNSEHDSRRFVFQHGWLCIASGHGVSYCDCGDPPHRRRSECSLAVPPVAVTYPDDGDYVNTDCPVTYTGDESRVCTARHNMPTPNRQGLWQCPATARWYRFCDWCVTVDEQNQGWHWTRGARPSVRVQTEFMCSPSYHGYVHCGECGDYYAEDSGECCEPYVDNEDDYDDDDRRVPAEQLIFHSSCGTTNTYFNELTEEFVCRCVADGLRTSKVPVKMVPA